MKDADSVEERVTRRGFLQAAAGAGLVIGGPALASAAEVEVPTTQVPAAESNEPVSEAEALFSRYAGEFGGSG